MCWWVSSNTACPRCCHCHCSNKNKSPNLWHVTSILVCCIFGQPSLPDSCPLDIGVLLHKQVTQVWVKRLLWAVVAPAHSNFFRFWANILNLRIRLSKFFGPSWLISFSVWCFFFIAIINPMVMRMHENRWFEILKNHVWCSLVLANFQYRPEAKCFI